ncbi:DNA polymerase I [Enterococcus phage 9181]|nr:DNA polymerase I [Enterococcus phage 9181]
MLKVNLSLGDESKVDPHEAIAKATKAKQIPTIEESWEKILGMKNSKKDLERLNTVKEQMELGNLGREEDKLHKAFSKAEALRLYKRYQESMREQRLKEMFTKDLDKYPLLTDIDLINDYVYKATHADGIPLLNADHMVSLDTETVGNDGGVDKYREKIAGWSLTFYKNGVEYNGYIPIEHYQEVEPEVWELDPRCVDYDKAIGALSSILISGVDTVWHNATFDLGLIYALTGVEPKGTVHDTLIIMHLLKEDLMSYALKTLATQYLNIPSDTFSEMFGKNAKSAYIPLDAFRWYASKDTWVGYKLLEWQVKILSKPQFSNILKAYLHIEAPCIKTTFHTERTGFVMDMEEVERQHEESVERIAELEKRLADRFGDVNFGSPAQLQKMLYFDNDWSQYVTKDHKSILDGHESFDEWGISNNGKFAMTNSGSIILDPVVVTTNEALDYQGKITTKTLVKPKNSQLKLSADSDALKAIAKHAPELRDLLELKDLTKHLTSFVEKIPTMVSPDGRLHGDFKQSSTVTLRYTASNPNLQQQPYKARLMFTAPEGQLILSADFSQQEPRLATHMSNCKALAELYRDARDLYSETASSIFNKPLEECGDGSIYRKQTKVVVLAVLYGMSHFTLAGILGISNDEGKELIDNFYKTYPELHKWIKNNEKEVAKQKYVETPWGTRRRFTDVNFNLPKKPWGAMTEEDRRARSNINRALRQATNAKVQTAAAMQTKQVMVAADNLLEELNKARGKEVFQFLALVHDEILYLVPEDVTKDEVESIRDVMINTVKLIVPSKTDMALGKCWGTLQEIDYIDQDVYLVGSTKANQKTEWTEGIGEVVSWKKLSSHQQGAVYVDGNDTGLRLSEKEWANFISKVYSKKK